MPELPEVHTTATMLNKMISGLQIKDIWTDYNSPFYKGKQNIKDPAYFRVFKNEIENAKILKVHRIAKNVLIDLDNGKTIIIHMKMTGHLLYGTYKRKQKAESIKHKDSEWEPVEPEALKDPYNRFVHLMFTFSNGKNLALCDTRKFATVSMSDTSLLHKHSHFENIGPNPLDKSFNEKVLIERLRLKPKGKIKTVLMDKDMIAGIGNIYSDEILWEVGIHPESIISNIPENILYKILKVMKEILRKGIKFGGDSMSDYRNPLGERGKFQHEHNVYQLKGEKCRRLKCKGIIERKMVGARSAHFCPKHQKLY